ncbi:helix-turn-helix transcriptional regulator [Actinocorallia libanotica]|uniref:DUF5753 domain-containing protein n=1 Tax=Actinocorallia libanotica TaxID=46162 RepID=A0ABN1QD14_9ACTN
MANRQGTDALGPQKSFVIEMRARRETAGLSRYKLAERLGCSPQWPGKVETFEKLPSEGLADDLDTFFATGGTFRRLWEQMVEARRLGLISNGFRPLVEAEKEAKRIVIYDPLLVTGLVQTEAFATHMFSVGARPDKAAELLAIRMERQEILGKAESPWLFILSHERVIRGIPDEFREEQCKRMLDLMGDPKVCIQLIPEGAPVYHPGGCQLLGFDDGTNVAYIDVIRSAALSAAESEWLIRSIMEGK